MGDHDFTIFSIIPSVTLIVDTPGKIHDSWYCGQVMVRYKDAVFEASSPMKHATELSHTLSKCKDPCKPVGPDNRLTYNYICISVQVSLIATFKMLTLDYLCATRTAPAHSWRYPVKRVMSTLSLGLQCVGLMREKGNYDFEAKAEKCSSLAVLHEATKRQLEFKSQALNSIGHVQFLLVVLLEHLELKGEKLSSFPTASDHKIDSIWEVVREIKATTDKNEKH